MTLNPRNPNVDYVIRADIFVFNLLTVWICVFVPLAKSHFGEQPRFRQDFFANTMCRYGKNEVLRIEERRRFFVCVTGQHMLFGYQGSPAAVCLTIVCKQIVRLWERQLVAVNFLTLFENQNCHPTSRDIDISEGKFEKLFFSPRKFPQGRLTSTINPVIQVSERFSTKSIINCT